MVRTDLLYKWAEGLLDRVPGEHFNMLSWYGSASKPISFNKHECGTTACALGWLPYILPDLWRRIPDTSKIVPINHRYRNSNEPAAVKNTFGISKDEAITILFSSRYETYRQGNDVNKRDVAERIFSIIDKHQRP